MNVRPSTLPSTPTTQLQSLEVEADDLISRLIPVASRFRTGMRRLKRGWAQVVDGDDDAPHMVSSFVMLKRFPKGCCGKTSMLLTRYLHENGFPHPHSVYANLNDEFYPNWSHEWVEVGNIIVDITADQFNRYPVRPEPVIVTADRAFHSRFSKSGEFRYSQSWAEWKWLSDHIVAADWLYATVKRLADRERS